MLCLYSSHAWVLDRPVADLKSCGSDKRADHLIPRGCQSKTDSVWWWARLGLVFVWCFSVPACLLMQHTHTQRGSWCGGGRTAVCTMEESLMSRQGRHVAGNRIVAPRLLLAECQGARHLTLTAPDDLAVALHRRQYRRCVNVHN